MPDRDAALRRRAAEHRQPRVDQTVFVDSTVFLQPQKQKRNFSIFQKKIVKIKQENQEDQVEQGDEKDKDIDGKHEAAKKTQDKENEPKTDKQIQAEAILNALKDQEKINQKRQISKSKSKKLEKDW